MGVHDSFMEAFRCGAPVADRGAALTRRGMRRVPFFTSTQWNPRSFDINLVVSKPGP